MDYDLFIAFWPEEDEKVLIKHVRNELSPEKQLAVEERLLKEASTLEEFWSPYFPKVYDIRRRKSDDSLYIISQYFTGSTLAEVLAAKNKNILNLDFYLNFKEDLHFALKYLHQRKGVLHLDLSPDNIIIDLDQRAHLIDFDNSKKIGETISFKEVRGKPKYLAPDLKNQENITLGVKHDDFAKEVILKEIREQLPTLAKLKLWFPQYKKALVASASGLLACLLVFLFLPTEKAPLKRSPAIPKEKLLVKDEVASQQSVPQRKKIIRPKKAPVKKKVAKKAPPKKPTFKTEFAKLISSKDKDFKECLSLSPKRKEPILIDFEIEPRTGYLKKVDIKEAKNLSDTTQICLETIYRELHFPSLKSKKNIIVTQKFWLPSK